MGDSNKPELIAQLNRNRTGKIPIVSAPNKIKKLGFSFNLLREKLQIIDGKTSLVFFDTCVETIYEFESFRYTNKNTEFPTGRADHSISACRYFLGFLLIQKHMQKQAEKRKENFEMLYNYA